MAKSRAKRFSTGSVMLGVAQSMVTIQMRVPLEQLLREAADMYTKGEGRQAARALRAAATSLDNLTGVRRHYDDKEY